MWELMERFHLPPHEIEKIPYSIIQKMKIIDNQRAEEEERKANIAKFKSQNSGMSTARGQTRRFTREV